MKLSWVRGLQAARDRRLVRRAARRLDGPGRAGSPLVPGGDRALRASPSRAALLTGRRGDRRPAGRGAAGGCCGGDAGQHQRPPDASRACSSAFRRRVMVDIDPGFTQFWHEEGLAGRQRRGARRLLHDRRADRPPTTAQFRPAASIGIRFASRWCSKTGRWSQAVEGDRFTTVATWRGPFGPVEHGRTQLRPQGARVPQVHRAAPAALRSGSRSPWTSTPATRATSTPCVGHGWAIVDPQRVAGDPDALRTYVQGSGAEFSAAQGMYVDTACGWFSDRSVRYLASGKPVLVQDTGFSHILPVGEGLLAFRTWTEAVAGAAEIAGRYSEHCAAARGDRRGVLRRATGCCHASANRPASGEISTDSCPAAALGATQRCTQPCPPASPPPRAGGTRAAGCCYER